MNVHGLRDLAIEWLRLAMSAGWGVEGPEGAQEVMELVQHLARREKPDADRARQLKVQVDDRELAARPVDALFEAADLLAEASTAQGGRQAELLSAARGWLEIAQGRG